MHVLMLSDMGTYVYVNFVALTFEFFLCVYTLCDHHV